MTATDIVIAVLRVEAVVFVGVVAFILVFAWGSAAARASKEAAVDSARRILATHLEDRAISPLEMQQLRGLSIGEQLRAFRDVALNIGYDERRWLRDLARETGLLSASLAATRSYRWWRRLSGSRLLTVLGAEPVRMQELFHDRHPLVRSQAALHASQYPTPEGVSSLVQMLRDDDAGCRFSARDALMRLGTSATPLIIERLRSAPADEAPALLEVAAATASHDMTSVALLHSRSEDAHARLLAARLLRGIGGDAAVARLGEMLADQSPAVRESSADALGYLNHWPAAATVARLLEDESSRVRLAAALTLDRMGPPGELLLRRAMLRGSEAAARAASRILDDPARNAVTAR